MPSEKYSDVAASTLNGAINNSTTSVVVASATGFPTAGNFRIMIEAEIMLVTAVASNTFTVTRGIEGTTAASHADTLPVVQAFTKGALDAILSDNMQFGTCANLPAAEREGRIYQATDYPVRYRDTGSAWQPRFRNFPVVFPIPGNYSWTNATNHTGGNTNITNGPTILTAVSAASADKISKFVKTIATAPYTYTHRYLFALDEQGSYGGLCISDGTKVIGAGVICNVTGVRFWVGKWTNLNTFSADYITRCYPCMNAGDLRIRSVDDNTNRLTQYSVDGINYQTIHSVGRTDFLTATQVGSWLGTYISGKTSYMTWVSDE